MQDIPSTIIGNKSTFAIEFGISQAYDDTHFVALGFIQIFVGGLPYGIRTADATTLGTPLGIIAEEVRRRGTHTAPYSTEPDAGKIADAFRDAIYCPDQEDNVFFGLSLPAFSAKLGRLSWARCLDTAFDDGSYLLQFDVETRVRLIAFKTLKDPPWHHDPATLREVWLEADDFYGVLQDWCEAFKAEWAANPDKVPINRPVFRVHEQ